MKVLQIRYGVCVMIALLNAQRIEAGTSTDSGFSLAISTSLIGCNSSTFVRGIDLNSITNEKELGSVCMFIYLLE